MRTWNPRFNSAQATAETLPATLSPGAENRDSLSLRERAGVRVVSGSPNLLQDSNAATPHSRRAFTMIEIAISLAIIGFALVAIIGILPLGLNVQRDNRHETVINQDASIFLNAIRNGDRGLDDLTNYVLAITNYVQVWNARRGGYAPGPQTQYGYTRTVSTQGMPPSANNPQFPLISGARIVGLLSTPKVVPNGAGFTSNHVVDER